MTTSMTRTDMSYNDIRSNTLCPRCELHPIQNTVMDELSRTDNVTHICPTCGTDEAMENWGLGTVTSQDQWASRK